MSFDSSAFAAELAHELRSNGKAALAPATMQDDVEPVVTWRAVVNRDPATGLITSVDFVPVARVTLP